MLPFTEIPMNARSLVFAVAFLFTAAASAVGQPFAEAVFAAGGVASIFGVNDFVTVTRQAGAAWEPIVAAVVAAASSHL